MKCENNQLKKIRTALTNQKRVKKPLQLLHIKTIYQF